MTNKSNTHFFSKGNSVNDGRPHYTNSLQMGLTKLKQKQHTLKKRHMCVYNHDKKRSKHYVSFNDRYCSSDNKYELECYDCLASSSTTLNGVQNKDTNSCNSRTCRTPIKIVDKETQSKHIFKFVYGNVINLVVSAMSYFKDSKYGVV